MGAVYFGPMPIYETIFLLLAGFGVWFWLDSLKAREIGVQAAQSACADEGLQLLDETVVSHAVKLARDDEGRLQLRRIYDFEYSDTGDNRRHGSVTLLGHQVELLHIRPQLYVVPKAPETHETFH